MTEQEQTFLDHALAKVTRTRLIVPGETYAMNGIISVKTTQAFESIPSSVKDKLVSLVGVWTILGAISQGVYWIHQDMLGNWIIILLLFLTWGIVVGKKNVQKYSVLLRTSSGEVKVLESQDLEFIQQVTQALNQAIIARG